MATEATARVTITCFNEDAADLLEKMREEKIFHIENLSGKSPSSAGYKDLEDRVAKTHFLIETLSDYEESGGFLSQIEDNRLTVSTEKFIEIAGNTKIEKLYSDVSTIKEDITIAGSKLSDINDELQLLKPISSLNLDFNTILNKNETFKNVHFKIILLTKARIKDIKENFDKNFFLAELISIYGVSEIESLKKTDLVPFIALFHKEAGKQINDWINRENIQVLDIKANKGEHLNKKVNRYFEELLLKKKEIKERIKTLERRIKKYLPFLKDIRVTGDYLESELERLKTENFAEKTKHCSIYSGWVPVSKLHRVEELKENKYLHVDIEESSKEQLRPVRLKNSILFKPVELLTGLYGMPRANELDPTPYFAPWFLFFLGFCLGDAGYGLLMIGIAVLALRKLNLTDTFKSFMMMFFWGGLAATVVGVLTGSYFALDKTLVPDILLKVQVIDTLKSPMSLLVISIVLGLLQLLQGIVMEAYEGLREEKSFMPLLQEGGKLVFIIGAAIWVTVFLGNKSGALASLSKIGNTLLIAGVALIILFSAGKSGNFVRQIFKGLYNLYGMTSYLGDTISYARLMALGLATVLIGMAVNILAGLAIELTGPVIGGILAFLIFIFGHIFNLVINLVSAFVHSMRLQYVEFFKQFYVDGGNEFKPFSWKQRYVKLID